MSYDFSGKRALVTGGSRGIGKEVVRQLAKYGAEVFALSKNQDNLDALKAEIPSVVTICVDIADWKKTRDLVDAIDGIDLLVNNAGILHQATLADVTEDQIDHSISVNVKPIVNVSQIVTEKLKREGKPGCIVNVSSLASLKTVPDILPYSLSKMAVDKLTKMMAVELAPFQIRVNSVNPTATLTDMVYERFQHVKSSSEEYKKLIPLGDFCTVEDIANSILFLLSDKSRMITGTNLPVDGGRAAT